MSHAGTTDTVLMIRPNHFGYNEQTAPSNVFQRRSEGLSRADIHDAALREFEGMVKVLEDEGVEVIVFDDNEEPQTPDAIFPNNWITTHADGSMVIYPMEGENRRLERRSDIVDHLRTLGFRRIVDLTPFEKEGRYLEGTGSMVLDRAQGVVYACVSSRTDIGVLDEFAERFGLNSVHSFSATVTTHEETGLGRSHPIYHTNVMMALGENTAVVCTEVIRDNHERGRVMSKLRESGRHVVEITTAQLHQFVGNMLQLRGRNNKLLWAMSTSAFECLTPHQRSLLRADGSLLVHAPLDTIEFVGGGSARCMLAEVFRPK